MGNEVNVVLPWVVETVPPNAGPHRPPGFLSVEYMTVVIRNHWPKAGLLGKLESPIVLVALHRSPYKYSFTHLFWEVEKYVRGSVCNMHEEKRYYQ